MGLELPNHMMNLFFPIFIGGDVHGDGVVYIRDQEPRIYTRSEAQDLLDRLNQFYAEHTDEMIDEFNEAREKRRAEELANSKPSQPARNQVGHLYLIRNSHTGAYKIGISKHVQRRFRTLNKAAGGGLELVHTIETNHMQKAERKLHERFAAKSIQNEWFNLDYEDVDYLKSLGRIEVEGVLS